jgi:hypothetical protein
MHVVYSLETWMIKKVENKEDKYMKEISVKKLAYE